MLNANVDHGGTRSERRARYDFSTNANALGPDPLVVEALREVDPTAYPDPAYRRLREEISARHARDPDEVVVGAGASELLHRIAGTLAGAGAAVVWEPTFSEYRHAATVAGLPVTAVRCADAYLEALDGAAVALLCQPNSPDGRLRSADVVAAVGHRAAALGVPVVCDLAYAPLSPDPVPVPPGAWELHSPNKAHGTTGVRAAYLLAPAVEAARLRARAPSWVLSAHGEAFLLTAVGDEGRRWVARTRPRLWVWRDRLAAQLCARGFPTEAGVANYLLTDVSGAGGATAVAAHLERRGVAVRTATSFGLPGHLRLRAHRPEAVAALTSALDQLSSTPPRKEHP